MNKFKRLGFFGLILSALALGTLVYADTVSISTDENGVTTQTYSSINGTAKVEHIDQNSSAIQDSLYFKQQGVATTTPPEILTGGTNESGGTSGVGAGSGNQTSVNVATFTVSRGEVQTSPALDYRGVSTESDFQAYARSVMNADGFISTLETTDGEIDIWYFQPTKLMGIIDALVLVNVTVEADGDIVLGYPDWYDLFGKADNRADFSNELRAAVRTLEFESGATVISPRNRAATVNTLVEIMRDRVMASGFASTTEAIVR